MESVSPLGLWNSFKMEYNETMSATDPRVANWYLISNEIFLTTFIAVYIFMVYHLAPKIVRKSPRLDMWKYVGIYNGVMFCANFALGIAFSWYIGIANYSLVCQPVRGLEPEIEYKIVNVMWYYHVVKLAELGDTIFLILVRRKQTVPFIYVYHHISTVFASWVGVKFIPGGSTAVYAAINTWVHVALYSYYKMSEYGFAQARNVKKFILVAQIVQFGLIIILCIAGIVADCGFPGAICKSLITYMASFVVFLVPALVKLLFK